MKDEQRSPQIAVWSIAVSLRISFRDASASSSSLISKRPNKKKDELHMIGLLSFSFKNIQSPQSQALERNDKVCKREFGLNEQLSTVGTFDNKLG